MTSHDETAYCRSRDGHVIHHASCRHAATAAPWNFAGGMNPDKVIAAVTAAPWLRLCGYCWPEHPLARRDTRRRFWNRP